MQRIYSNPETAVVHLVKNELERRGIETLLRGEHLAIIGAPLEAWGELWIVDERQLPEAARMVEEIIGRTDAEGGEPWTCPQCGEDVDPEFAVCWNCEREQSAGAMS